jgi:hypothetical protein
VSNFFIYDFRFVSLSGDFKKSRKSQKGLKIKGLLASLFDSNCNRNGHSDHGVVTCAYAK